MYIDESKPFLSKFVPEEFQEDSSKLRFPKEFDANDCHALMISEVFLLLDHRKKQSEEKVEIEEMSPVFMNTYEYTKRFLKFKNRENIRAVRGWVIKRRIFGVYT
jgi:DNA-directed RNA polymerase II subunit RPB4